MNNPSRNFRLFILGAALLLGTGFWGAARQVQAQAPSFNCGTATGIAANDCVALVALYDSTDGANWTDNSNWTNNTTPCAAAPNGWFGVSCTGTRVTGISLGDNGLNGSLPPQLSTLTQLKTLFLGQNSISGTIPPGLGSLTDLEILYLDRNSLEGEIPAQLGQLVNVAFFYLNGNMLGGLPPLELCDVVESGANAAFNISDNRLDISATDDACFATKDADWKERQTVPPVIKELDSSVPNEITLVWEPIPYTAVSGGYEVFVATTADGFGPNLDRRLGSKTVDRTTFTGLDGGQEYYFQVRSYSNAEPGVNANLVESEFTDPVSETPLALALVEFSAGAPGLSWLVWGAVLVALLLTPVAVAWWVRRRLDAP